VLVAEEKAGASLGRRPYLFAAAAGLIAFLSVVVLLRMGMLQRLDIPVYNLAKAHQRAPFSSIAHGLGDLAWWVPAVLIVGLIVALWWSGRMVQALYLGLAACAAVILNPLLKQVFVRHPPGSDGNVAVCAFPSGHTTVTTAVATVLAVSFWPTRRRWPVVTLMAAVAALMGLSRAYSGAHWLSDVVGGWALGVTIAFAVRGLMPWPTAEEAAAQDVGTGAAAGATAGGPAWITLAWRRSLAAARGRVPAASGAGHSSGIDVVFLDWGNTLMVDNGMRDGPMKDWERVEAEPGAQEALLRLRARYRLVVATNAASSGAADVRLALARVGLDGYIDDVVSSVDVGDHKPNYSFFRTALLREGERGLPLDPSRAVMVGDGTTNDIAGAQRAGMRTIWYNPTKRRYPQGAAPPDVTIRTLTDLPAAVDRVAGLPPERLSRAERRSVAAAAAQAAEAARQAETTAEAIAAAADALAAEVRTPPVDATTLMTPVEELSPPVAEPPPTAIDAPTPADQEVTAELTPVVEPPDAGPTASGQ
jgi:HAD superfamily hydrolase (TIGR01509 family)